MELLKKLTSQIAPSGNEKSVRDIIIEEIRDICDEINVDVLGNLIARKKGNGKKAMLTAHMDEVGFITTVINDDNFIRFSKIGGVKLQTLQNRRVVFENGLSGIINLECDKTLDKSVKIDSFYIDVTSNCKVNKLNSINVGNVATFEPNFEFKEEIVTSKALDDRIGCYILINVLKKIKESNNDLYFVFTAQEELGLRGAKTAANKVCPDYSIAVDVTSCDDIPGGNKLPVKLGEGPAIKIKDSSIMCHPYIKTKLCDTAEKLSINIQYEVLEKGGTDAGAVHTSGFGVITGALSIPCRYLHSPSEMININDANDAIKILTKVCEDDF